MNNWKRNTTLFLGGQAITMFGSMIVQYAIFWHITLKTQSGGMLTVLTIATFIPILFTSPFGGVWADRYNRKLLINWSDFSVALVSLIIAILLHLDINSFALLMICAVIRAAGQGVQMPAVGAVIPQIVPEEKLVKVNGIQGSIQSVIGIASPAAAGALMSVFNLQAMFILDVATAAIGISILAFFVKVPNVKKTGAASSNYLKDLSDGFRYIKEHKFILQLGIISAAFLIAATPSALLTPLQVTRNFGNDVWNLTAVEIAFFVGMLLGGGLMGAWGGFKNKIYSMALAALFFGIGAFGLGVVDNFPVYIAVMAFVGVAMPIYNAPFMALLQAKVENAFAGRVMSAYTMLSTSAMPLGMLIFGPLADKISIDSMLIFTSILIIMVSIPLLASKTLREAGK